MLLTLTSVINDLAVVVKRAIDAIKTIPQISGAFLAGRSSGTLTKDITAGMALITAFSICR
jgi:hypothetical protein